MNINLAAPALLAGVMLLQQLPRLPSAGVLSALVVLALLMLTLARLRPVAVFLLGFAYAGGQAADRLALDIDPAWQGRDLRVQGRVVGLPEDDGRRLRLLFACERVQTAAGWQACGRHLRLNWYQPPVTQQALLLQQRWDLQVRLKPRQGFRNPGGFDYAGWLFQQNIQATGYIRRATALQAVPSDLRQCLLRLRQALDARVRTLLADHPQLGVIRALTLGARDGLDHSDWTVFRVTGTSHLMAISGLHIGLVAGSAFTLGRLLWSRSAGLSQRLAAPRFAALGAIVAALAYALLAGMSIPTRRALIMATVILLALCLGRPTSRWQGLALALLLVILLEPLAVHSPGFWLSFAAVAIIFACLPPRRSGFVTRLRALVVIQLSLSLGLLPLTLLFFGQLSWSAPVANLLAVPWTGLVVVPLLCLALLSLLLWPALGAVLLRLAADAVALQQGVLGQLAALPVAASVLPQVPAALIAAALLAVAMWLAPVGLPGRRLALLLVMPLFLWQAPRPAPGSLWLTLLDVGQGLAVVVQTARHTLVYDTGPRWSARFDTGAAVVAPWLRQAGVRRLDRLVISHGDNDHRGGAAALDALIPAYSLITSVPDRFDWRYSQRCSAGQSWQWDGVAFHILAPPTDPRLRGNDASCVLQIETADGTRALLSGDIEAPGEAWLLAQYGERLRSELLIAPHHGSRSSSTPAWVAAVAPQVVLFPVGLRNRYGFPHAQVVARYARQGSRSFSTATDGALTARLGGAEGLAVGPAYRRHRYWDPIALQTVPPSH